MRKRFPKLLVILGVLIVTYRFIAQPFQITGGRAGNYNEREIVFAISRKLLFNRPLSYGDTVVYLMPSSISNQGIGVVYGIPGDKADDAYYYSGEPVGKTLPEGFYLINLGGSLKVIPDQNISYLVWLPIRNKGPIPVRNPY